MARPKVDEATFTRLFETIGPLATARKLGVNAKAVFKRRRNIEAAGAPAIQAPMLQGGKPRLKINHPGALALKVWDGVVLIGSDAHIWPDTNPTALRAFVRFCKMLKPAAVILNGDVLDGATISRHPPIGWTHLPSLAEEIKACQEWLDKITVAAGKAQRFWTMGNHDARFEAMLAKQVPEVAGVKGTQLHDFFPDWQPCWLVEINDSVIVKHRFKNGIHSVHNGTLWAGRTIINGHLHSLKVWPMSDYGGTRWGVDCGTLSTPYTDPFIYTELNPVSWRSGFIVLTFVGGELLWPEIVWVQDEAAGIVEFRGKRISV